MVFLTVVNDEAIRAESSQGFFTNFARKARGLIAYPKVFSGADITGTVQTRRSKAGEWRDTEQRKLCDYRSEERRVGKECVGKVRSSRTPYPKKKKNKNTK